MFLFHKSICLYYLYMIVMLSYDFVPAAFLTVFDSLILVQLEAVTGLMSRRDRPLFYMHLIQSLSLVMS